MLPKNDFGLFMLRLSRKLEIGITEFSERLGFRWGYISSLSRNNSHAISQKMIDSIVPFVKEADMDVDEFLNAVDVSNGFVKIPLNPQNQEYILSIARRKKVISLHDLLPYHTYPIFHIGNEKYIPEKKKIAIFSLVNILIDYSLLGHNDAFLSVHVLEKIDIIPESYSPIVEFWLDEKKVMIKYEERLYSFMFNYINVMEEIMGGEDIQSYYSRIDSL